MLIDTMKSCIWFSATIWAIASCAPLQAQTDNNPAPQKGAVTKLDGTKYFGLVEVTDDYTIRITNDAGISRLPITQLVDTDFQKYGFQKDRSKDGRFWYERKEALKDSPRARNLMKIQTRLASRRVTKRIRLKFASEKSPLFSHLSQPTKRRLPLKRLRDPPHPTTLKRRRIPPTPLSPCFLSRGWEVRYPSHFP